MNAARRALLSLALGLAALASVAHGETLRIVAAENFYADVARQIGGTAVSVTSILSNPAQDPHLFEVTPSAARAIAGARIVIYSGIDYDPWMAKLLAASGAPLQQRIVVADLIGRRVGDNPHIWYDPQTMPALAQVLAARLIALDAAHRRDYERRLMGFRTSMQPIQDQIDQLHRRFAGVAVTATEPVLNDLLEALGLQVRNRAFQRAIMNNTEPTPSELAAFESDLEHRQVRLLIYNEQSTGPMAEHMKALAQASHIPVLGVTETEPAGERYQDWMLRELSALEQALRIEGARSGAPAYPGRA